jgi:hypothetical protein
MIDWKEWGEEMIVKIGWFVIGSLGAVVSFLKPRKLSFTLRVLTIAAGGLNAYFITPVAIEVFHLGPSSSSLTAYIIGFMGYKSIELTIDQVKSRFGKK